MKKPIDYRIAIDVEQNSDNTLRTLVVTLSVGDRWSVVVRRCWPQQGVIRLELAMGSGVWAFVPDEELVLVRVLGAAHTLSGHINKMPYDFVGCDPDVVLGALLPKEEKPSGKEVRGRCFYAVVFPDEGGMLDKRGENLTVHRFEEERERDLFIAMRPFHRRKANDSESFVKRAKGC